jgi:hypothetical protein
MNLSDNSLKVEAQECEHNLKEISSDNFNKELIMTKIWFVALLSLLTSCVANKSFSPSPAIVTPRLGFLGQDTMMVSFFDSRSDQQYSENIKIEIVNNLKRTYPSCKVLILADEYFAKPSGNNIYLKINIMGYNSGFGIKTTSGIGIINGVPFSFSGVSDGKWNGIVGFIAVLYDNRDGEQKFSANISHVITKPNVGGYRTARNVLQDSFQSAMNSLVIFIDQSLL